MGQKGRKLTLTGERGKKEGGVCYEEDFSWGRCLRCSCGEREGEGGIQIYSLRIYRTGRVIKG